MKTKQTKYGLYYVAERGERVQFTDPNDQTIEVRQHDDGLEIRAQDGTLYLLPSASNVVTARTSAF